MARTTEEIKKTMTDAFLQNETLREVYGIEEGTQWKDAFSTVSLENILLFIVAAAIHVVEVMMDQYKEDVNKQVAEAVVASVPWYHAMALRFQLGDQLVINPDTYAYGYAEVDETKQVVKYCAVRDRGTTVQILVSGEQDGQPLKLDYDTMAAFTDYMNKIKVAGVMLSCSSYNSDHVKVGAHITVDPLVINRYGQRVDDTSIYPVEDAIKEYLRTILYGGTLNKTRLVDAIQAVPGVEDVELEYVDCRADAEQTYTRVAGNNYKGVSGSYIVDDIRNTLDYVV